MDLGARGHDPSPDGRVKVRDLPNGGLEFAMEFPCGSNGRPVLFVDESGERALRPLNRSDAYYCAIGDAPSYSFVDQSLVIDLDVYGPAVHRFERVGCKN